MKKFIILISIIVTVVLTVLSFGKIDYNISKYLINESSIWAGFFNVFGHFPALLGLLISAMILYGGRDEESIFDDKLYCIIPHVFLLGFSYVMVFTTLKYMFKNIGLYSILVILLTIVIYGIAILIIRMFSREKIREYKTSAIALLLLIIIEIIIVNILKIIWARPRMRTLESFEGFKYWWQINGPLNVDDFKSFPSGHTANSFVVFGTLFFIPKANRKLRYKVIMFAITWGVLTAISRLVLGAHFLSDVVFSGCLTIALYYILADFVYKKYVFRSDVLK